MDGIDSKIYKLRTETDKMDAMRDRMDSNFESIHANQEVIARNKKNIDRLSYLLQQSERIEGAVSDAKREIASMGAKMDKEVKKIDSVAQANHLKNSNRIDKIKQKLADLYYQINEEEESEISSDAGNDGEVRLSDKTKSLGLLDDAQKSSRSHSQFNKDGKQDSEQGVN